MGSVDRLGVGAPLIDRKARRALDEDTGEGKRALPQVRAGPRPEAALPCLGGGNTLAMGCQG